MYHPTRGGVRGGQDQVSVFKERDKLGVCCLRLDCSLAGLL